MQIEQKHLDGKPRLVGTLNGRNVSALRTKGGFNMIVAAKAEGHEVLGCGPHAAVARLIAKKKNPDIKFTELSKGDWVDPQAVEFLMPKWEHITDRVRTLHGD